MFDSSIVNRKLKFTLRMKHKYTFPLQNRRLSEPSFRDHFFNLDVTELHLDVIAGMDLQADGAVAITDLLVVQSDHRLAVKPGFDVSADNPGAKQIPVIGLERVDGGFFRQLEPSPAIGFVYAASLVFLRGNFDLPTTHFGSTYR